MLSTGCGSEEGVTCGADTEEKDGKCIGTQDAGTTLVCGDETVEKDGQCVPKSVGSTLACGEGTAEKDGKCVVKDPTAKIECGAGTVEKDGKCILDTQVLMPSVSKVEIHQLNVAGDGVKPLMVLHDVRVSAKIDITGEPFESMIVVGVHNKDMSKMCNLGYWSIKHVAAADESATKKLTTDAKSFKATYTLTKNFVVQPSCEALIGEKDLVTWAAFDPFQDTNFAGRKKDADKAAKAPEGKDKPKDKTAKQQIAKLLKDNALSLAGCKAGANSSHPENCATKLTVVKSAGIDLRMEEMTTSTSVVVLEYAGAVPPAQAATSVTVDGKKINVPANDWSKQKPHISDKAALYVSTEMSGYGIKAESDDEFSSDDLGLTFMIRPSSAPNAKWVNMSERLEKPSKAGNDPTVEYLEKVFLKGLVAATRYLKDSPIYFTQAGKKMVTTGDWSQHAFFDVKICADGDFKEGGVDADPKKNNCKVKQVVLIRHKKSYLGSSDEVGAKKSPLTPKGGAIKLAELGKSLNFGDTSKLALSFETKVFRQWDSTARTMRLGARKGTYIKGWFPITLIEEKAWLEVGTKKSDNFSGSLTLFNIKLSGPKLTTPENFEVMIGGVAFKAGNITVKPPLPPAIKKQMDKVADALKKEKYWEKFKDFSIIGPLRISVGFKIGATANIDFGLKKSTSDVAACDATAGNYCYQKVHDSMTFDQASAKCLAEGGVLAGNRANATYYNAVGALANKLDKSFWNPARGKWLDNKWSWYAAGGPGGWVTSTNNMLWTTGSTSKSVGACAFTASSAFAKGIIADASFNQSKPAVSAIYSWPCTIPRAVVCEMPAQPAGSEKSEAFAVIEPGFVVDATGYAGLSLFIIRGGIYVKIDLFKATLPLEGGMRWQSASSSDKVSGAMFVRLKAEFSTLNGELGVWYQWFNPDPWTWDWASRHEYPLFAWDGFKQSITLFESDFGAFND